MIYELTETSFASRLFGNWEETMIYSCYTRYQEGIEIQVDTKNDERRKHLATICCAKLILECLEQGLYPSWDAQNLWSVRLAEKLGYELSHEYIAYEVN